MIKLLKLETAQLTPASITVTWSFESGNEDFNDYRINLYQAQGPATDISEYNLVASGLNPAITSSAEDTSVRNLTDKFVDYFYRISVSGLNGQGYYISDYAAFTVQQDKYAREIERRRGLVFDHHSGQDFFILKRKSYGTLCPDCYDPTLGRTTKSKCTTCYDTGYVGGYMNPVKTRGQINERPTREMHQMFGGWQDQDAVLYLQGNPPLNPKDIIVDRISRRWIVLNLGAAQKSMYTISQIAQLRQIEKDDVMYQYYIDTRI